MGDELKRTWMRGIAAAGLWLSLFAPAAAQQGVTADTIVIGSNGDLSGIFAPFNVQAIEAARMAFDEINAAGGVHGRQIRFIVEDHAYQMPRAIANFNKLIRQDGVFAMLLNLGTPMNLAGFPLMQARKVANVAPLSGARQMIEGDISLKYSTFSSYYDQILAGIEYLVTMRQADTVCAMYLPTDFGTEVQEAAAAAAARLAITYGGETTHKGDEGDFAGAIARLRQAGCDIVATGLGVRQTILLLATARKLGWDDVAFIGSAAAFHEAIAAQPGGITEGYYAAAGWSDYHDRLDMPEVRAWHDAFLARYGAEPGMAAILGKSAADILLRALEAAGPDLTPESFRAGMETLRFHNAVAGIDISYGPGDHRGGDRVVISVVENGAFREVARR